MAQTPINGSNADQWLKRLDFWHVSRARINFAGGRTPYRGSHGKEMRVLEA